MPHCFPRGARFVHVPNAPLTCPQLAALTDADASVAAWKRPVAAAYNTMARTAVAPLVAFINESAHGRAIRDAHARRAYLATHYLTCCCHATARSAFPQPLAASHNAQCALSWPCVPSETITSRTVLQPSQFIQQCFVRRTVCPPLSTCVEYLPCLALQSCIIFSACYVCDDSANRDSEPTTTSNGCAHTSAPTLGSRGSLVATNAPRFDGHVFRSAAAASSAAALSQNSEPPQCGVRNIRGKKNRKNILHKIRRDSCSALSRHQTMPHHGSKLARPRMKSP
eukprot:IDg17965t1